MLMHSDSLAKFGLCIDGPGRIFDTVLPFFLDQLSVDVLDSGC